MNKEQRENLSFRATQRITMTNTKFGLKSYGDIGSFRSQYEHAFAVYLKELDIKFEFEKYGGEIKNYGQVKLHYIPDFYLPEYDVYIEIVNTMNRRLEHKMYAFQEQHKNKKLFVFDKNHLRKMFDSKFTIYDVIGYKKKSIKKILSILFILAFLSQPCFAFEITNTPESFNKVVDAIYKTEGGAKAKKPFGILSVPCSDYSDCRKVCYNTVRNNFKRWQKAGKPGTYLEFLAFRYAPVGVKNDPWGLNRNWLNNMVTLTKGA